MKKTLYLIRHGETDWNVQERFQGHIDIPLNERGRNQARGLIPYFQSNPIEAILSSDLSRSFETGKIIADAIQIPIFRNSGLREAHMGEAQGLTREEMERRFGSSLAYQWRSSKLTDADISYPGGETGRQVMERAFQTMEQFLIEQPYERIGIATHGGVIRRVMHALLPEDAPPVEIPNVVVYEVTYLILEKRFSLLVSPEIS